MARFRHHLQVEEFASDSGRQALEEMVKTGRLDTDSERIAREWLDVDGELVAKQRWLAVLAVCTILIVGTVAITPFMV
jgi:hypothetical protein